MSFRGTLKYYETKEFRELERLWEEKLRQSGFIDVEKTLGSDRDLQQRASNAYRNASDVTKETRLAYYSMISERYARARFCDPLHRFVMQRVADGRKLTEIHAELIEMQTEINYETIRFIVRRYEYKWKIRNYTARQMNLKRLPTR